jgi:FKBP-type peptidyl-prolyl cis-trans isomerase
MNNKLVVGLCVVLVAYAGYYMVNKKECVDCATEAPQAAPQDPTQVAQAESSAPEAQMVALESGLKYQVLVPASSPEAVVAAKGNTVTVDYTGQLDENGNPGKEFDSSVKRGQKFSFTLGAGQVIPGWEEGIAGMKAGEKRHLVVPAHLAYGEKGAGNVIPANATLHFDVELFEVA